MVGTKRTDAQILKAAKKALNGVNMRIGFKIVNYTDRKGLICKNKFKAIFFEDRDGKTMYIAERFIW